MAEGLCSRRGAGSRFSVYLPGRRLLVPLLTIGLLMLAPPAAGAATLGSSQVTTPANNTYLYLNTDTNPSQTITISGTATDTANMPFSGTVDLDCTLVIGGSTLVAQAAANVTVAAGSFSTTAPLSSVAVNTCVMRAVPAGTVPTPAQLTPFAGPNLALGQYSASRISGSTTPANNGKLWNYQIAAQGFSAQMEGFGLLSAGLFAVSGLGDFTPAAPDFSPDIPVFHGQAWFNNSVAFQSTTNSELRVDGKNAYPPAGAQSLYTGSPSSQDTAHFEALQVSGFNVDPATGVMTLVETDPIMRCMAVTDPTPRGGSNPPSAVNCPDFVDTGVKLVRTITYDHDGQQIHLNDSYQSTDGSPHTIDLRYFNGQQPPVGSDAATQYKFDWPGADGGNAPHTYTPGTSVVASPSGIHTIYVNPNGGNAVGLPANGSQHYDRGALTISGATDGALFFSGDEYEFELNYLNRTVPATGSFDIGMVYSVANTPAGLDALVTAAQNGLKSTPTLTTTPSAGGPMGTSLNDVGHLSGLTSPDGTGTVGFKLYAAGDANCSGSATTLTSTPSTVTANGDYTSQSTTPPAPGTYHWIATFSGDSNNSAVSTQCSAEIVIITSPNKATPTLTTTPSAGGPVGTSVKDVGHLLGLTGPDGTGKVTFNLYGAGDSSCSGSATTLTSTPSTVTANGDYTSQSTTPPAPGTYHWIATFSGDSSNNGVSTQCSDETITITPAGSHQTKAHVTLSKPRGQAQRKGCRTELNQASTAALKDRQCNLAVVNFAGTIDKHANGEVLVLTVTGRFPGHSRVVIAHARVKNGRFSFKIKVPSRQTDSGKHPIGGNRWTYTLTYAGDNNLQSATKTGKFTVETEHR